MLETTVPKRKFGPKRQHLQDEEVHNLKYARIRVIKTRQAVQVCRTRGMEYEKKYGRLTMMKTGLSSGIRVF